MWLKINFRKWEGKQGLKYTIKFMKSYVYNYIDGNIILIRHLVLQSYTIKYFGSALQPWVMINAKFILKNTRQTQNEREYEKEILIWITTIRRLPSCLTLTKKLPFLWVLVMIMKKKSRKLVNHIIISVTWTKQKENKK